jgi:hypothetical protein
LEIAFSGVGAGSAFEFPIYRSLSGLRYDNAMKPVPDNPEFARFTDAMRSIVKVSKAELNKRIAAEKKRKVKPSASRASVSVSKA